MQPETMQPGRTPRPWVLVPIKPFAQAKTRLESVLSRDECALLAEHMARDVLRALHASGDIAGIAVLTREARVAADAAAVGARVFPEPAGDDYLESLARVAALLEADGARDLLVVPADLPTLSSADVRKLLALHRGGLTLCRASRDGGSNALLLTPPTALPFLFGQDSARRHLEAAAAAGIAARAVELPGFARDIDSPDDLGWLLAQKIACATRAWLKASGIQDRLRQQQKAAP